MKCSNYKAIIVMHDNFKLLSFFGIVLSFYWKAKQNKYLSLIFSFTFQLFLTHPGQLAFDFEYDSETSFICLKTKL